MTPSKSASNRDQIDSSEQPADETDLIRARYDETPYRDGVFDSLDLSRLLGLSRLFKLGPEDPAASEIRVLDLACASGAHIRAQAGLYPGVHFTGIDFSESEVEMGRKALEEEGLDNVDLISCDLREADIPRDSFDLILCHGAFSWVPDDTKDRIFELCRTGLKARGIAAIAYLTYPGWKQREAIRELLAYRVRDLKEPAERISDSALMLRLLHAGYDAQEGNCHAESLKTVVEWMQRSSSNVFLHDELGAIHDPCYFIQFVEWASEWGLQYLAESDLSAMAMRGLPISAAGLLQRLAPDFLETQQLIDFLVNRSGRTSLLVRNDAQVAKALSLDALAELQFTTTLVLHTRADRDSGSPNRYETTRGDKVTLDDPRLEALIERMRLDSSRPLSLADLVTGSEGTLPDDREAAKLLLPLIALGYVDPRLQIR